MASDGTGDGDGAAAVGEATCGGGGSIPGGELRPQRLHEDTSGRAGAGARAGAAASGDAAATGSAAPAEAGNTTGTGTRRSSCTGADRGNEFKSPPTNTAQRAMAACSAAGPRAGAGEGTPEAEPTAESAPVLEYPAAAAAVADAIDCARASPMHSLNCAAWAAFTDAAAGSQYRCVAPTRMPSSCAANGELAEGRSVTSKPLPSRA